MRSITTFDLQYAHRFYNFKGEAQYLHGHTGTLTIEVEDTINCGVNMIYPCNEIKKIAWNILQNFDHALVLRQDDPLLPAVLGVYEAQGIRNGDPTNTMKGPEFRNMGTYRMTNEQLRIKLTSLTAESGGVGALVIAECTSPRQTLANSLAMNGIYDFDHTFIFDDYTAEELFEILRRRLATYRVRFSDEASEKMRAYIEALCTNRNLSFANARTMKLLARTIYEQVVLRESHDKTSPRRVVLLEDVKSYNWQQSRRLGY